MADLAHLQAVAQRKIPRSVDTLIAALRERRLALGLTQADVARAISYHRRTVIAWENGRRPPAFAALVAYAAAVDGRIELVPLTPPPLQITDSVVGLKADHHDSARLTRLGHSANEIATRLGCSQRTVQRHQARAREEAKSA